MNSDLLTNLAIFLINTDLLTNLGIFLLIFIMLSLFFRNLAIYTERERGQRSGPPKLARDPWETMKFESCGGAKSLLPGPDCPSTIKLTFINV